MLKRSYNVAQLDTTPAKTKFERLAPPETLRKSIFCQHPPRNLNGDIDTSFHCSCEDGGYSSAEWDHPEKIRPKDLNPTIDYEYISNDGTYALTIDDAEKFVNVGYHVEDVCIQEMDPKMLNSKHPLDKQEAHNIIEYPIQPIEDALRRYDSNLRKEQHVIGEATFSLNRAHTKFISVGLSPTLEFAPIIKIRGRQNRIFFTPDQFMELVEGEENMNADSIAIGDHRITKTTYKEKEVYKFECRNSTIVMVLDTFKNLFELGSLIRFKLKVLESMDFPNFYTAILRKCSNNNNVMELNDKIIILIVSELPKDYKTSLLLEVLKLMYNKKMSLDYQHIQLNSNN